MTEVKASVISRYRDGQGISGPLPIPSHEPFMTFLLDLYEGRYGIENTRQAMLEVRQVGLVPFCVTIDDEGAEYLPRLLGTGHFVVICDPSELPQRLPRLHARLTQP